MIDIDKAMLVLVLAALDPNFLPPYSDSLIKQAKELDLLIERMNWTTGMYFGPVVGQDDQAWLIKIGTGRASVLPFCEIEEGAVIPRLGDNILLTLTHGLVHVVVFPSSENNSEDEKRLD
ncbi:MAG TPA: hypothetical protein VJC18_06100 [bacterium]|nr:hypothetical protein [bacterium]